MQIDDDEHRHFSHLQFPGAEAEIFTPPSEPCKVSPGFTTTYPEIPLSYHQVRLNAGELVSSRGCLDRNLVEILFYCPSSSNNLIIIPPI